jgi:hypothetical protein
MHLHTVSTVDYHRYWILDTAQLTIFSAGRRQTEGTKYYSEYVTGRGTAFIVIVEGARVPVVVINVDET